MKSKLIKAAVCVGIAGGMLAGAFGLLLLINNFRYGDEELIPKRGDIMPLSEQKLTILSWNIGYAGLGAEADFKADGGKSVYPVSRETTEKHIRAFTDFVALSRENGVDFFMMQEVAQKSSYIFKTDPYHALHGTMEDFAAVYSPSVDVKWFPLIGSLHTGNVLFSRFDPDYTARHQLPLEKGFAAIFNPNYNFLEARYAIPGSDKEWVLVNLHLSAFDEGGQLRKEQLAVLTEFITAEYDKGNYVVVGGDWNHRLVETDFPHTTKEEFLFWIHDLPPDFTPAGWKWGIDPSVPTVRTNERPYADGENYTCVIDGFLVSPNVRIEEVRGIHLHFEDSDHNPVRITVSAKE